jgi:Cu+-exporting ATPase
MVGVGKGAENGILIKSGEALETAHKLNTVVFDKTGTLTKGEPEVTDIITLPDSKLDSTQLLQLAAMAEKNSEHPLGAAIVKEAAAKGLAVEDPEYFDAIPGQGVEVKALNSTILLGNRKLMETNNINISTLEGQMTLLEQAGKTAMLTP